MRYVSCLTLALALSACAKAKRADNPPGALSVPNMECVSDAHSRLCATPASVTETKPSVCKVALPTGSGEPLPATGRTSGVRYTVANLFDCGVVAGLRCYWLEYANGYQDLHCDDWELP